jgi:hypothetical protein
MVTNNTLPQQRKRRVSRDLTADAPIRALYDGRDRIGEIICHDHQYIARDRLSRELGTFDSPLAAARAIGDAFARGGTS